MNRYVMQLTMQANGAIYLLQLLFENFRDAQGAQQSILDARNANSFVTVSDAEGYQYLDGSHVVAIRVFKVGKEQPVRM